MKINNSNYLKNFQGVQVAMEISVKAQFSYQNKLMYKFCIYFANRKKVFLFMLFFPKELMENQIIVIFKS